MVFFILLKLDKGFEFMGFISKMFWTGYAFDFGTFIYNVDDDKRIHNTSNMCWLT